MFLSWGFDNRMLKKLTSMYQRLILAISTLSFSNTRKQYVTVLCLFLITINEHTKLKISRNVTPFIKGFFHGLKTVHYL